MKKILLLVCIANSLIGVAQMNYEISDTILRIPQVTYFGLDFSHVRFFKVRPNDEVLLKDGILAMINKEYAMEQIPGLGEKLNKTIIPDNRVINSLNDKFVDSEISGDNETIEKILEGYKCSQDQGIGLVFMVSELDKMRFTADLYPVFFDITTKKIIWKCQEFSGAHNGITGGHGLSERSIDSTEKDSLRGPELLLPDNSRLGLRLNKFWYDKISQAIDSFLTEYQLQYKEMKYKEAHEKRFDAHKSSSINGLFIRLIPNEFGVGYQWTGAPKNTFMVEVGYRIRYSNSWSYIGSPLPYEYLERPFCYGGPSLKMTLRYDVSRHSSLAVAIGFQHLYCPEVTYDPDGYGGSGSPDAIYQVYSCTSDEFLLQLLHYVRFGRMSHSPVSFFYGIGLKICRMTEHFSIDGSEEQEKPSTRTGVEGTVQPLVTFGLLIRIIRIPNKSNK